jgi:regulation of enolase protein 1 (concanavalin A-like superfamily)
MQPSFESILHSLGRISSEFLELRDGIQKAVQIAGFDPEMALTRARKVLEHVIRDVYLRRCNEEPGTRPLENLTDRLVKDGHFPRRLSAYAAAIRILGNVATHAFQEKITGETITASDVYLSLILLLTILEWFFEVERPASASRERTASGGAGPEEVWIDGWGRFIDPDNDCAWRARDGKLTILVPGSDHDLGIVRNLMNAPRALQPVDGDFVLEVTVAGSFRPWDQAGPEDYWPFHGAGLLLFGDEDTFVRLERATARVGKIDVYCNYELRSKQEARLTSVQTAADYQLRDSVATRLQLRREGGRVLGAVAQEDETWRELPPIAVTLPDRVQVGVAAVTTSTEAFAPVFYGLTLERKTTPPLTGPV